MVKKFIFMEKTAKAKRTLLLSAFITALSAPMVEFKTALIYYYMIFFINFVLLKQWHLLLCIAIVNPIK